MAEKNEILVSCIIPTFNRVELLKEAIESTITQTFDAWELIVVDDQSDDDTAKVVNAYIAKDKRIRYYLNPDKGANKARNLGISKARGKYIAFLDDDDVSLPHRFQSQVQAMQNSGSRFIVSWFDIRDRESGNLIKEDKTVLRGNGAGFPSRWMIEKTLLVEVGGFNPDMIAMQEIELSYRLAKKYTFHHHDDVVTTMYSTPGSTSKGEQGILGKVQLMKEAGRLMHPVEAAWWYYVIAMGYFREDDLANAKKYLKTACKTNFNFYYLLAYSYFKLARWLKCGVFKKLHLKVLGTFSFANFPVLVKHQIL